MLEHKFGKTSVGCKDLKKNHTQIQKLGCWGSN